MNTVILSASAPLSVILSVLGLQGVMVTVMMRKKTAAKKLNAWSPLTGVNHTHTKSTTIRVTYKDGSN
jgi:hypothetical protein